MRYADVIEFAFAPELEALSPHVERTVRLSAGRWERHRKRRVVRTTFEGSSRDEEFLLVDPAFFEVFDFPLLLGDAATALAERNSVVLSYEMAQRLFGDADPLGQSLTIASRGYRSMSRTSPSPAWPRRFRARRRFSSTCCCRSTTRSCSTTIPRMRGKARATHTSCSRPMQTRLT